MRTSTLLTHTTCWWFELAGSHEMIADEQVMPCALTADGPRWAVSRPMIIVQAASRDVRRFCVTLRTLMRCGCVCVCVEIKRYKFVIGANTEKKIKHVPVSNRRPRRARASVRWP